MNLKVTDNQYGWLFLATAGLLVSPPGNYSFRSRLMFFCWCFIFLFIPTRYFQAPYANCHKILHDD